MSNETSKPGLSGRELTECLMLLHWTERGLAHILDQPHAKINRIANGRGCLSPAESAWVRTLAAFHRDNRPPPEIAQRRWARLNQSLGDVS
ncbi:hypothetical protein AD951_04745 [Acetobacter malorum]|uniref:Uncharacterized protein n=1 Tax=Acetobacter malorum TaxID=178901 RepID=A0A149UPK6_9PROT|nr:hypothetical protein [Acetobacter malorum]KXV69852.1 hypothetical protein AD951_04745 [Acetobacter malorum]